jgi:ADP-ribose pyrophosphatase YjhB (NUDIX family)
MAEKRLVSARTLCFVENGDDVLMLKGAPSKRLYANSYNGLGGHVEAGEDILSCMEREVQEECGLAITHVRLRAVVNVDEAGRGRLDTTPASDGAGSGGRPAAASSHRLGKEGRRLVRA